MGGYKGGSLYRGSYSYVFPVTAAVTSSFPSFQSRLAIFLLRKIVFVRACVRPCVCTPFPYCDFATFHFLFGNRRNRRFSNKKCVASLRPTSYLKSGDFGRKYAILRLTSYLKSDDFGRKYAILWLTSYLKSDDLGRKYAMLDENTRFCGSLLI